MKEHNKSNNAQKAKSNTLFVDSKAVKSKIKLNESEIDVTLYSDGSSTHHFGGPIGNIEYDENGEEC